MTKILKWREEKTMNILDLQKMNEENNMGCELAAIFSESSCLIGSC